MHGKYFDDWVIGEEYVSPSRTLTETDVVIFAAMSGDYNELHTSEEFMKGLNLGDELYMGYWV
jgi:acyl dehydratase